MVKTTEVINATVTYIRDGDFGQTFTNDQLRTMEAALKETLKADDVHIEYAKTFVMEEHK